MQHQRWQPQWYSSHSANTDEDVESEVLFVRRRAAMTLFVAHEVMAELLAYEITKVLLERTPELASADAAAKEISSASAVRGSPVPFRPGALRYYKEAGIAVPQS